MEKIKLCGNIDYTVSIAYIKPFNNNGILMKKIKWLCKKFCVK